MSLWEVISLTVVGLLLIAWAWLRAIDLAQATASGEDGLLWVAGVVLLALHFGLAFLLVDLLAYVHLTARRYQLAYFASAGFGCLIGAARGLLTDQTWLVAWIMAFVGAWLGAFTRTMINEAFWEDNFPPTPEEMQAVYQAHREVIGDPPPTPPAKRIFDISVALLGLIISAPVWIMIIFLIWLEDAGPILFIKNSVGRGGKNFHQYKFRTMIREAERETGPVLASENDDRVLWIGKFLRKTALDELPQLLNILMGDMSFVGPRPQRTVLVREYLMEMPEYAERHKVLPGISGLAQVLASYYISPRQKLRYDRFYIRHASFGLALKLLLTAFLVVFWFRWQKDWDGKLPRGWLRLGKIASADKDQILLMG